MSNIYKKGFLQAYKETNIFRPFLSSFFSTSPRDIINAESFVIDIKRGGRKVAPVISNIAQNGSRLEKSVYTQKDFKPPVIALGTDCTASDLINKEFGKNEYEISASEAMMIQEKFVDDFQEIEAQIMRNLEFQASQIFQTGTLTLYDENGVAAYTIDFKPKSSHFATAAVSWSTIATANPDSDMIAVMRQVQLDGKASIKNAVFGKAALNNYLRNADIRTKFDMTRYSSGIFNPQELHPDADFLGDILVENKRVMAWSYEGQYEDPTNPGTYKDFVDTNNVILLPEKGGVNVDLRAVWCTVPSITGTDPRFAGLIPSSMVLGDRQFTPRVYADNNADSIIAELKCRPLLVPVSIDSFGCLDTII